MIFVPTLPQSGTWFVLRLLEKCGYRLEFTGDIVENKKVVMGENIALSCHIFPFYYQAPSFKEAIPHYAGIPLRDYVVRNNHMSLTGIELLSRLNKTIIPIRDPLACLLTREARAPQLRHFYIVDGFVEVVKRFESNPNVFFFPVDLYTEYKDRLKLLYEATFHCGIQNNNYVNELNEYAINWKKENSAENRFRESYEQGNLDKIKEMLGNKWAEVEYLKIWGGTIMPFLRDLGYGELLW